MLINSSQLAARLNEQITSLYRERDGHLAAIAEIEGKIAKVLALLGLDPNEASEAQGPAMQRLSRSDFARAYPLDPNTMGAVMVETLLNADHGYSRVEMRKRLETDPRFARQIAHNINAYYNTVNRYLKKGRIVDVGNLLYHPSRAPLPAGQDDPTGQHLPPNVSSLFADRKVSNDEN